MSNPSAPLAEGHPPPAFQGSGVQPPAGLQTPPRPPGSSTPAMPSQHGSTGVSVQDLTLILQQQTAQIQALVQQNATMQHNHNTYMQQMHQANIQEGARREREFDERAARMQRAFEAQTNDLNAALKEVQDAAAAAITSKG